MNLHLYRKTMAMCVDWIYESLAAVHATMLPNN